MDNYLHFVLLDRAGKHVPVFPGFHPDPTRALRLPRQLLDKIGESKEFYDLAIKLLESNEQFFIQVEYDVYPISIFYLPSDDRKHSGVSTLVDFNRSIATISYLTIENCPMDAPCARVFGAQLKLTEAEVIDEVSKHSERPLCFSAVPHFHDSMLAAARMTFAAAYFDAAIKWKARNA